MLKNERLKSYKCLIVNPTFKNTQPLGYLTSIGRFFVLILNKYINGVWEYTIGARVLRTFITCGRALAFFCTSTCRVLRKPVQIDLQQCVVIIITSVTKIDGNNTSSCATFVARTLVFAYKIRWTRANCNDGWRNRR